MSRRPEPRHPPRQFPPPRSVADLPDFNQPASGLPSVATRKAPAPAPRPAVEPRLPPYRPVSSRLRGWIVVLTLLTALGIAALMLRPQLRLLAAKAERLEKAEAAERAGKAGKSESAGPAGAAGRAECLSDAAPVAPGCPGSAMPVRMLPAAPVAASPDKPASR